MRVSDLLHVSKSLSAILSFQMETLYSQIPPLPLPRATVAGGLVHTAPAQQAAAIPASGFCVSLQEGKGGRGGWTFAATGRIELLINI